MIRDGMIHIHYMLNVPDKTILNEFQRVENIKYKYNMEQAVGVFVPNNLSAAKQIVEENPWIFPSLYIDISEYKKSIIEEGKDFYKAIKIHNSTYSTPTLMHEAVETIIKDSLELGLRRFQIHCETLPKDFINTISKYAKKDVIFHLVHGVDALYNPFPAKYLISVDDIKKRKGNFLLGTSRFNKCFPIPDEKIQIASKEISDMMVFESDFIFNDRPDFYEAVIGCLIGSTEHKHKILYENIGPFFKLKYINKDKLIERLKVAEEKARKVGTLNGSKYIPELMKGRFDEFSREFLTGNFESNFPVYDFFASNIRELYLKEKDSKSKRISTRVNIFLNRTFYGIVDECIEAK